MRALLFLALASCSFTAAPGKGSLLGGTPSCTPTAPIIDTVFGAALFAPAIYYASISENGPDNDEAGFGLVFVGLPAAVVGTVLLASATYGYVMHSRCRARPAMP